MSNRNGLAKTPPMGWNSYTCYWISVRENEIRVNADYMAEHLARYGWEYVVVDGMWYHDTGPIEGEDPRAPIVFDVDSGGCLVPKPHPVHGQWDPAPFPMDSFGRLLPDPRKFPSASNGAGFKPLADYVHGLGLKFGLHIMRGIPRLAVEKNTPILNTSYSAGDVADMSDTCPWYDGMYGMKMDHPGAQAYYDSLIDLYVSWEMDYIKADDMGTPRYRKDHVEALARAIDRCGRPIVLSLSTGAPDDTTFPEHRKTNSELWRIADDLHDKWPQVRDMFDVLPRWTSHAGPGHWPDPDMLPLGRLHIRTRLGADPHMSRLSRNEQVTVMTLWSIGRSPLMFAGDLPGNDEWTLRLITNPEVIAVNQRTSGSMEAFRKDLVRVWTATAEDGSRYTACFNLGDKEARIEIPLREICGVPYCNVRDLWAREDLGVFSEMLLANTPAHGAGLFKLTPKTRTQTPSVL